MADSTPDPDGDGVNNFAEYWNQCDPMMTDTDGDGYSDTGVRLSGRTLGDGSEGLWYGRLVFRWPESCGQETEGNRIRLASDIVVECDPMEVSFRGEVETAPRQSTVVH